MTPGAKFTYFTDEDLKLLKEDIANPLFKTSKYILKDGALEALLARLEASERKNKASDDLDTFDCIHGAEDQCGCGSMQKELLREYEEAALAWRKSKGLGGGE